jgi:hypothetical protein
VVPASALVPKPDTLDWAQASGLMVAGVTAWHLLAVTGVSVGDTVLIHGAAGGVGVMAVQLAVDRGATVVATGLPARHDFLRQLGAIPVEYGSGLMDRVQAVAPDGVDAALDLAGTDEALDVSFVVVPDRTRIATIVSFERGLATGIRVLGGAPGADHGTEIRETARLELARLAQDGKLRVFVSQQDRPHPVAGSPAGPAPAGQLGVGALGHGGQHVVRDGQIAFRQAVVQAPGDLADTTLDLLEAGRAGGREGDLRPSSRRGLAADQALPGQLGCG